MPESSLLATLSGIRPCSFTSTTTKLNEAHERGSAKGVHRRMKSSCSHTLACLLLYTPTLTPCFHAHSN